MAEPTETEAIEPPPLKPGELDENEIWWRDHQVWLQERGYMLRPRYRPDWTPSWEDTGRDGDWVWHEDSIMATVSDFTLDMLHVCISYTVASFRYGRNSSIGRRDRYP